MLRRTWTISRLIHFSFDPYSFGPICDLPNYTWVFHPTVAKSKRWIMHVCPSLCLVTSKRLNRFWRIKYRLIRLSCASFTGYIRKGGFLRQNKSIRSRVSYCNPFVFVALKLLYLINKQKIKNRESDPRFCSRLKTAMQSKECIVAKTNISRRGLRTELASSGSGIL